MTSSAIRSLEFALGTSEASDLRRYANKAFVAAFVLFMTVVLLAGAAGASPVIGC